MRKFCLMAIKRALLGPFALWLAAAPLGAAELYRWVDEKGHVEWRDTPPPPNARKIERRTLGGRTIETIEMPYGLRQAAKSAPVTLWMTDCGDVCNRARAHLNRRGVPHAERNPEAEMEAFKKASGGGGEMPLLIVGGRQIKGYMESDWDAALDSAGYPKTAVAGFKPQPKPAAPQAAVPPVKLYTAAQCGLQCENAKGLLGERGITFDEIGAEDASAMAELKKAGASAAVLPVLAVGRFVVMGFNPSEFHRALDQAGYQRVPQ